MAIAFVRNSGTNANKAGGNTTLAITVPAAGHALGNTVVLALGFLMTSPNLDATVTDSKGNTWTQVEPGKTAGVVGAAVYASTLTAALVSGDTITATMPSSTFTKSAITAAEFSGLSITESVASLSAIAPGGTTTPSVGPITPADAATLMIGALGLEGPTGDVFTQDSDTAGGAGWSAATVGGTTGGSASSNMTIRLAYKITTSAVAQTYNPTLGTSRAAYTSIVSLRAAGAGATYTKAGFGKIDPDGYGASQFVSGSGPAVIPVGFAIGRDY